MLPLPSSPLPTARAVTPPTLISALSSGLEVACVAAADLSGQQGPCLWCVSSLLLGCVVLKEH